MGSGTIYKLTPGGDAVLKIPGSAIPDEFKRKGTLRLTAMDVAPDGDLYVVDGYANDYVHHFDASGKYIKSFGGRGKAPYNFNTLHKIGIDTRLSPPRIIGTDRANMRVVHLSLDGDFPGVVAKDLLLPAAVVISGDYAIIGEIKGRLTFLDKQGNVAKQLGCNDVAGESGTNKTPPAQWRLGLVTAPHGVAVNAKGDLFVSEYSTFGRVHRWNTK